MKKLLVDAYSEAKKLPKVLWLAAVIVPGGLAAFTVYIAGKSAYKSFTKKETNEK